MIGYNRGQRIEAEIIQFVKDNNQMIAKTLNNMSEVVSINRTSPLSNQRNQPVVSIVLDINIDDFGKSKRGKWNPITAFYLSCLNFARTKRYKKGMNRRFCAARSFYSSLDDLLQAWVKEIQACNGMTCYSPFFNCDVIVQVEVLYAALDNTMASELGHHMGTKTDLYCRFCSPTTIGEKRVWAGVIDMLADNSERAKEIGLKRKHNQDGILGESMNDKTPLDALHNFWLGTVKHVWTDLLSNSTTIQKTRLLAFFNSIHWLKGNPVRHSGSFQGNEFRLLALVKRYSKQYESFASNIVTAVWDLYKLLHLCYKTRVTSEHLPRFPTAVNRSQTHHLWINEELGQNTWSWLRYRSSCRYQIALAGIRQ